MTTPLFDAVSRYAEAHARQGSVVQTPIPGLSTVRATEPSGLLHAIAQPLVCLVLQGSKQVAMGARTFEFSAGESLLITADVPTVSQITRASAAAPYLSIALELSLPVIADLSAQMGVVPRGDHAPVHVDPTDAEVADVALRLMRLLDRPEAVPLLHASLVRELHYWLLAGRHGAAIRRLGWPGSHAQRIARAVAVLRADFAQPLPVESLAALAGMSPSSFHQHFRAVTSLSPLQFQKQLRLIEARRLMLSEGASASSAAFAVGYESVPQFTREYGRLFGLPPVRDTQVARDRTRAVG
ncbi:AraC family transcriptional regulator [Acidovorax sp. GW101-3H11]|uniref:AraC family transcriptional regulator n=1 Tax=unclassified Acidovorax TaxID=2684926 RepID=UPI0007B5314D|nr:MULTISPECIES: AraC family transcriptional regulator [unclassified Acidovorax]KZT17015.1 AraC family transcriptional regulator [Acidovorax sp. GW101-3H11]MBW8461683.1 AraC family transcriptional regulator [Acidovorax sp.]